MNKSVILIVIGVVVSFLLGWCAFGLFNKGSDIPSDYKVALVDVQYLVAKSSDVKKLREDQEKKVAQLQKWLAKVKAEVEKQKTEKAKEKLIKKYNDEFAEKQAELKEEYAEKLQVIDEEMTEIIEDKANELGYDIVVSKGVVLTGGEDITSEIAAEVK